MTDREPMVPADPIRPSNLQPRANPLVGDLTSNAHLEPAQRGDCLPMSLTLAPRPPSRHPSPDAPPADSLRTWLSQIASPASQLTEFAQATLPGLHHRAPAEAYAAARAAACPDLFAIHAPDPIARERIIADIAWASAEERILVLSTDPSTADRVVERLVKVDVQALRALADDENPIRSSPLVSKSTSSAVVAARMDRLKRDAANAAAEANARIAAIGRASAACVRKVELTRALQATEAEILNRTSQRERVENGVRSEVAGNQSTAFAVQLAQHSSESQTGLDLIRQERLTALGLRKERESHLADLRKHAAEVASDAGKKSGFFARLLGKTKHGVEPVDAGKILHEAERELNEISERIAALDRDLDAAADKLQLERERLIQAEIALRRTECDGQLARCSAERDRLAREIEEATGQIDAQLLASDDGAAARLAAESDLAAARQRLAELDRTQRELGKQVLASVRVVVAIPGSLPTDPVFARDLHPQKDEGSRPPFDLLVLDRAEELTEPDFIHLAKLAARWVLIGSVVPAEDVRANSRANSSRPALGFGRNGRAAELPFAARMANALDRERWTCEADWLVCRLEHLPHDARRGIVREPLLDRPEIELRFAASAEGTPLLAEVAFPLGAKIASAKALLHSQLNEVFIRPLGAAKWQATPSAVSACWPAAELAGSAAESTWIDLEPGVKEKVVGSGLAAFTAQLTFDTQCGWTAESAEAWLNERYSPKSPCRFAHVPRR